MWLEKQFKLYCDDLFFHKYNHLVLLTTEVLSPSRILFSKCRSRYKFLKLITSSSFIEDVEIDEPKGRFDAAAVVTESKVAMPSASSP